MWQKCPICNGNGTELNSLSSSCTTKCRVCGGAGIISEINGLPPNYQKVTVLPQIELNNLKNPD